MAVPNLYWSLPVPSVQELARDIPSTLVPRRYIRDDVSDLTASINPSLIIPLLNMADLINSESRDAELQKLFFACRDWGAFQLINHGIPDEIIKNMKKQSRDFFDLPSQQKRRYTQKLGSLQGYGQAFVVSEEQKLDWNDMIFLHALPIKDRDLNFWPEEPQGFRETLDSYSIEVRRLAVSLLGFMAMALGLEAHEFSENFQQGQYHVRMNCYPSCPLPEKVIGISPHSDISAITFLLECNDTPGIQFQKDGYWVPVEPISGAITVNIGRIGQIISNGVYHSAEHRAIVNKLKERLSIVTFCYPNENGEIGPARGLITQENPVLYKTVSHADYFHRFYYQKHVGDQLIDSLKADASQ
ncbi:2-oxoglutarate-dependent dioxygenase 11-like [Tasmannia lanceolata]|uniref:2-oxoglutarate-dependent dioxygenase 11-like n=1 Tax=Tasmannia lanceolata TaxID=3420 RepID=UPI004062D11F